MPKPKCICLCNDGTRCGSYPVHGHKKCKSHLNKSCGPKSSPKLSPRQTKRSNFPVYAPRAEPRIPYSLDELMYRLNLNLSMIDSFKSRLVFLDSLTGSDDPGAVQKKEIDEILERLEYRHADSIEALAEFRKLRLSNRV